MDTLLREQGLYSFLNDWVYTAISSPPLSSLFRSSPLQINILLQGNSASIIDFSDKLKAFRIKLILWKEKILCDRYDIFENMNESFAFLQKDEITEISEWVQNLLQSLSDLLGNYFSD